MQPKKDILSVRIDQSGKFSAMTLLRAMAPEYSRDADLLRCFYETVVESVKDGRSVGKILDKIAVDDIVYPAKSEHAGEIILEAGQQITRNAAELICTSGLSKIEVMDIPGTPLVINSLNDDTTGSHEEAVLRIYQRLRPGNPPNLEKARTLFQEKFFDSNRYRLGRVGRFRINRKLKLDVPETEMTLRPDDLIESVSYILKLAVQSD
jgi:DNA-directed RNA polymerase subunit beta